MRDTPEAELEEVLQQLLHVTSKRDELRKTAFRWFNRLYYDIRGWNKSFIKFLHTYPGFRDGAKEEEYEQFFRVLEEYEISLEQRSFRRRRGYPDDLNEKYSENTTGDLCNRLDFLNARFEKDFHWLREEDSKAFWSIQRLIVLMNHFPGSFTGLAGTIIHFINSLRWDWRYSEQHENNRGAILEKIREYEEASQQAVENLRKTSERAGYYLISVDEYDAALSEERARNPQVMYVGEVTMSQDEIHIHDVVGPVNVKSRLDNVSQVVNNAPSLSKDARAELGELIKELQAVLQPVIKGQPDDGERVIEEAEKVAKEVARYKPGSSFLGNSLSTFLDAAKAVSTLTTIGPPVLDVANRLVQFVRTHFNL